MRADNAAIMTNVRIAAAGRKMAEEMTGFGPAVAGDSTRWSTGIDEAVEESPWPQRQHGCAACG